MFEGAPGFQDGHTVYVVGKGGRKVHAVRKDRRRVCAFFLKKVRPQLIPSLCLYTGHFREPLGPGAVRLPTPLSHRLADFAIPRRP